MTLQSEFDHLNEEERVKAENNYTKMKLMLEKGAEFHNSSEEEVDPFIEKEMLNYVMEFERQAENPRYTRVYDKINQPTHFKPSAEIPDEEIAKAWEELSAYMDKHQVNLDACSPNVTVRELYRFTTEELFELQINDISIPGMKCMFIYDEFYPDPVYDNTRTATDDCIRYILGKNCMEWSYNFRDADLRLNEHYPLSIQEFKTKVNQYKSAYDEMDIREIKVDECKVNGESSIVSGSYLMTAYIGGEAVGRNGDWKVFLEQDKELGYWYITNVQIQGVAF